MSGSNGYATRDDFLGANKRRFADVELFGGMKARIRSLTAAEFAEIDAKNIDYKRGGLSAANLRLSNYRLIVAAVVDGDGNPLFTEADVQQLAGIDAIYTEPLVREIKDHCGLRFDAEDLRKNSETTGGSDSPCTSAEPSPAASTA